MEKKNIVLNDNVSLSLVCDDNFITEFNDESKPVELNVTMFFDKFFNKLKTKYDVLEFEKEIKNYKKQNKINYEFNKELIKKEKLETYIKKHEITAEKVLMLIEDDYYKESGSELCKQKDLLCKVKESRKDYFKSKGKHKIYAKCNDLFDYFGLKEKRDELLKEINADLK